MLMSMKRDARKLQPIVQEELRRRAVAVSGNKIDTRIGRSGSQLQKMK